MSYRVSFRFLRALITAKVIFVTVFCALSAVAAQDKGKGPIQIKDRRIPIVTISPRDSASLPTPLPGFETEKKPAAGPAPPLLSWSDRRALLRESGFSSLPAAPPEAFRLSARQSYVADAGWLAFSNAYLVDPKENYAGLLAGSVIIAVLNLERGRYVMDFNLSASSAVTYRVSVADSLIEFLRPEGPQRISVVIDSSRTGWANVYLESTRTCAFRGLEIMRIGETGSR